jgi:hypothetical protein
VGRAATPAVGATSSRAQAPAAPVPVPANFVGGKPALGSGGNPYWSENNLTATTTQALSDLRASIRIAQNGGVVSTGTWSSVGGSVTVTVTDDGSGVDYVFKLKPGVVLPPGSYGFQAQYNHAAGARDTRFDAYDITAVTSDQHVRQDVRGQY